MKLRPYQKDIIDQTVNSNKSTLIQIPTGGGKTLISKEIIRILTNKLNQQVLFIAPKIILMEQTAEVFDDLDPYILHRNNKSNEDYKVLVSTNQTASKRDINPDVIIIDEVHYGYEGKMLQQLIQNNPYARIIGLSATPYNKKGEQLKGFDLILDNYDIKYMIKNKYLVDMKYYKLTKIKKLDTVKITGGDYNISQLSKIVCDNQTILEIVGSTIEYINKYKKAIVFAVDINHSELLTKAYQNDGYTAKVVHSKMDTNEIRNEIDLFKKNQTKILVSVAMLTTGFDVPDADVVIIARPTKSQNLYKQMVGRVLRLSDGKPYAVLLDCGNVIDTLGFPLEPIKKIETKERESSNQKCEVCDSEHVSLQIIEEKSFWICKKCGNKKAIEKGVYECKLCNTKYTHNAKFLIKNNKLWLDCNFCPHPTLISEYTGGEKLVEVYSQKYKQDNNSKKSLVKILEEKKREKALEEKERTKKLKEEKSKKDFIISLKDRLKNKINGMKIDIFREFINNAKFIETIKVFKKRILATTLYQYDVDINKNIDLEQLVETLKKSTYKSYINERSAQSTKN